MTILLDYPASYWDQVYLIYHIQIQDQKA